MEQVSHPDKFYSGNYRLKQIAQVEIFLLWIWEAELLEMDRADKISP